MNTRSSKLEIQWHLIFCFTLHGSMKLLLLNAYRFLSNWQYQPRKNWIENFLMVSSAKSNDCRQKGTRFPKFDSSSSVFQSLIPELSAISFNFLTVRLTSQNVFRLLSRILAALLIRSTTAWPAIILYNIDEPFSFRFFSNALRFEFFYEHFDSF